jgi:hypothetical protein
VFVVTDSDDPSGILGEAVEGLDEHEQFETVLSALAVPC